jgi:UDP-glucose 4-epimerase
VDDTHHPRVWREDGDASCRLRALLHGLRHPRTGGPIFGSELRLRSGHTVLEVYQRHETGVWREFPVDLVARRPGDIARIVPVTERIRSLLGWYPLLEDLQTIVTHVWAWERQLALRMLISPLHSSRSNPWKL